MGGEGTDLLQADADGAVGREGACVFFSGRGKRALQMGKAPAGVWGFTDAATYGQNRSAELTGGAKNGHRAGRGAGRAKGWLGEAATVMGS